MEENKVENKKGNGKIILIVFLIIIILGLGGYIFYDKTTSNSEVKELESKVEKLNNQITTINTKKNQEIKELQEKQNSTQQNETPQSNAPVDNNRINAVYYGHSNDANNNYYPKEFLALFNDGRFVMLFVDGEGSNGTYEINGNQLIIHRDDTEGPLIGDRTYEISQDKTQIKADGLILQKR